MKNHLFSAVSSSSLPSHIGVRVDVPLFIPDVDPAGGLRFAIDLVQLFLARILSFFHNMFTFTLFELCQLPIMLASCNRAFLIRSLVPLLCAGCCPRMIASCNQSFRTLTSTTGSKGFFYWEWDILYLVLYLIVHSYVEGPAVAHVLAAGRATVSPLPPLSPLPIVLDMTLLQQPLNRSPKGHNMTVQFYTGMGKSTPAHK